MSDTLQMVSRRHRLPDTLVRVVSYSATRLVALFFTAVVGIFVTILVANMGGYVDEIKRAEIRETVTLQVFTDPKIMRLPAEARERRMREMIRIGEERLRSEEHTSELQSRLHLVCRLLLEKKKKKYCQHRYKV